MNNVISFDFEDHSITVMEEGGEAWFVAKELAGVLGYSATGAMNKIIDEDDRKMSVFHSGTTYIKQSLINESGVYQAIFGSTKPEAKRFKKWVTSVVLPSIRKTGGYIAGEEHMESEEELIYRAMEVMKRKVEAMKPKADYYDSWMSSKDSFTTTEVAKQLGVSAVRLNKFLKDEGVKWKNKDIPISGYEHWFKVIDVAYAKSEGTGATKQCRINTEGAKNIVEMWNKRLA